MIKKLLILALIISTTACTKAQKPVEPPSTPQTSVSIIPDHAPGEIPFDFPPVELTSTPTGSYVLSPSLAELQNAWNYKENTVFTFEPAILQKTVETVSTLKDLQGKIFEMPNSLIIPLTDSQAQKSDILITWWQGGSGLAHAIVNNSTDESTPDVYYFDEFVSTPATLKAKTFKILSNRFQQGSPIAIKNGNEYQSGIIININKEKALVKGFNNTISVQNIKNVIPINLHPSVEINSTVYAPIYGIFTKVTVTAIDEEKGQIKASYSENGKTNEHIFFFSEIITKL